MTSTATVARPLAVAMARVEPVADTNTAWARLVFSYLAWATAWLLFGTLVGEYLGIKFVIPDIDHIPWLSFGRLRPVHTNTVFWGWSSLAMVGMALYVVPKTSWRWTRSGDGRRPPATTRSCNRPACGNRTPRRSWAVSARGPTSPTSASEVWQYMHLYNPRSVVPGSIMPAFPWLFDVKAVAGEGESVVPLPASHAPTGGVVVPNARGRALVAYLLARRQVPIEGYGGAR